MAVVLAMLALPFSQPASAVQIDRLYDVVVPVASQSSSELAKANKAGLRTVFIRVSGNRGVVEQPAISKAIEQAKNYTRQFYYEARINPVDGSEQAVVVIEFEPQLVEQQLRLAGLPLWSANRPSVLVWMAIDDKDGRRFVNAERDPEVVQAITDSARRRGLPVRFPTLDLQDMVALSVDDVWQLKAYSVEAAAERYHADTLLIGRVSKLSSGEWLGRWFYRAEQQQFEIDGDASSISEYVAVALDQVAESLAQQYAIAPVDIADGGVLLRLTGIVSFVDYARAMTYLESVVAIRHANVVSIQGDEILVRLVADGLLTQLQQAFALDRRIQPLPLVEHIASVDLQNGSVISLQYRWPSVSRK